MRVLMFQDRFAGKVRDGSKRQTIRKTARCKPGDVLSLRRWKGKPYRSKHEIMRTVMCTAVESACVYRRDVLIGGQYEDSERIAKADGFVDFGEMALWFGITHGLPFEGYLIRWSSAVCQRPA